MVVPGDRGAEPDDHRPSAEMLNILAWVNKDALITKLQAECDKLKIGPEALSTVDRERLLDEARASLRHLERHEEALLRQAESQGVPVLRRADADPSVVLGVKFEVPPGATVSPVSDRIGRAGRVSTCPANFLPDDLSDPRPQRGALRAHALLKRMRKLNISKYHPDPARECARIEDERADTEK